MSIELSDKSNCCPSSQMSQFSSPKAGDQQFSGGEMPGVEHIHGSTLVVGTLMSPLLIKIQDLEGLPPLLSIIDARSPRDYRFHSRVSLCSIPLILLALESHCIRLGAQLRQS